MFINRPKNTQETGVALQSVRLWLTRRLSREKTFSLPGFKKWNVECYLEPGQWRFLKGHLKKCIEVYRSAGFHEHKDGSSATVTQLDLRNMLWGCQNPAGTLVSHCHQRHKHLWPFEGFGARSGVACLRVLAGEEVSACGLPPWSLMVPQASQSPHLLHLLS